MVSWRRFAGPLMTALAALASTGAALEGGQAAAPRHFGIVGSISATRSDIGHGFSGVQIAPTWVLTAAHVAPTAGAIFANDFGISGITSVQTFPTRVPTRAPLPGALRDDLALVHLAAPIRCPYFPRLADETAIPYGPGQALLATLVSNNPALNRRRFGAVSIESALPVPGYSFAVSSGNDIAVAAGDSGSPMFLGHISDTDATSVLVGIASAQASRPSGQPLGIYTRVGAYRYQIDQAVQASGEHVQWTETSVSFHPTK